MNGASGIQEYAAEQLTGLLAILAARVRDAAQHPGAREIHDVRVSIRRFTQGLLLFADFFPEGHVKKIRRMLKRMMRLTSEVRNRDITLEYLQKIKHTEHRRRLEKERSDYQQKFSGMVRRWNSRDFSARWRTGLSLGAQ